ncbi:MAG TPA: retroviral-like aspartic protease family protein [Coleofasciculaceae cyanobacterium]
MWKAPLRTGLLIVLAGFLALDSVACSSVPGNSDDSTASAPASPTPSPAVSPPPKATASAASPSPKATVSKPKTAQSAKSSKTQAKTSSTAKPAANKPDTFPHAIDVAMGAISISQSAASREDWKLAATQWQQAINLLKQVPATSPNYSKAQQRVPQYQRFMAEANLRAAPAPKKNKVGDTNPRFFSIPIQGRRGGIPIVEVTFNGSQKFEMAFDTGASSTLITLGMAQALKLEPTGTKLVGIADGSIVEVLVAYVKSMEIDGRLKRNVPVSIAPPAMPIGLLGQDFFEGYDIVIKQDVIEFRKQ